MMEYIQLLTGLNLNEWTTWLSVTMVHIPVVWYTSYTYVHDSHEW